MLMPYPSGFSWPGESAIKTQVFFHDMQVRMAYARAADLDQNLAAGHRLGNISDLRGMPNASKSYCSHD
jgi:hypothetical protein